MTSNFKDAAQTLVVDSLPDKKYLYKVYSGIKPQLKQTALFMCGTGQGFGGMGIGASDTSSTPVQTSAGGNNWKQVANGRYNSAIIAVKSDGTLWSWGRNAGGQLGIGSTLDKSTPVQVGALTTWKSVAIDSSSFPGYAAAIRTDGTLWMWGDNYAGQLGVSSIAQKSSPVQVAGTNWKQAALGVVSTFALKTDGTLWGWGQLGGGLNVKSSPIQLSGATWKSISAGTTQASFITTLGELYMYGGNQYGELGTGTITNNYTAPGTFVPAGGGLTWSVVKCGEYSTAGIKSDGTLWVWGVNKSVVGIDAAYTLGVGDNVSRSSPTQIAGGGSWIDVSEPSVYGGTFGIKSDGTVWTWGSNFYRSMDQGSTQVTFSTPVQILSGGDTWKQVSGGGYKTAFLKEVGDLG